MLPKKQKTTTSRGGGSSSQTTTGKRQRAPPQPEPVIEEPMVEEEENAGDYYEGEEFFMSDPVAEFMCFAMQNLLDEMQNICGYMKQLSDYGARHFSSESSPFPQFTPLGRPAPEFPRFMAHPQPHHPPNPPPVSQGGPEAEQNVNTREGVNTGENGGTGDDVNVGI